MKRLTVIYVAVYIISNVLSAQPLRININHHSKIPINSKLFRPNARIFNTNDIGNITQEVWQEWSTVDFRYKNDEQFLYIYDNVTNKLTEYIDQDWDGTDWLNDDRYVYYYDTNNYLIQFEYYEWKNNKWKQIGEGNFSDYDANGNYGEESYSELKNDRFEYQDKFVYSYDSNNNITEKYSFVYNDPDWVSFDLQQFTYDGNCQTSITSSSWDGSQFLPADKLEFQYDSGCFAPMLFADFWWLYDGSPTSWTYSVWDGNNWIPGYHGEYSVNNCGWTTNGILYDTFNPATNSWEGESAQGIINYNESCSSPQPSLNDVRITSAEYQEYQNGNWVNSDRTLISYEGLLLNTKDDNNVINNFQLKQNFPNPFNPSTIIEYTVPENFLTLQLRIYDILGNDIATLVDEVQPPGEYSVVFNVDMLQGMSLSNGIYYYKLQIDDKSIVKKMLLVK